MFSKKLSLGVCESELTACCLDSSATKQKVRADQDRIEPELSAPPHTKSRTYRHSEPNLHPPIRSEKVLNRVYVSYSGLKFF